MGSTLVLAISNSAIKTAIMAMTTRSSMSVKPRRRMGEHLRIRSKCRNNEGVFKVEDDVIHVSGEEFGCLTTKQEYDNYRLHLEVKWGTKKWPRRDREKTPRDSGILIHCVGPDKVWTKSIECQIPERDFGDFFLVGGTTIEVSGKTEKSRTVRKTDAEKPLGDWNFVEVICDGDTITNIVNGVVVNKATKASVTRGKIILQSEGAEVFFRNITLTPLNK
jgi:hypothetical protein